MTASGIAAIAGHPNQIADVGIGLPFMLSPLDLVFDVPQVRDETALAGVLAADFAIKEG